MEPDAGSLWLDYRCDCTFTKINSHGFTGDDLGLAAKL